MASPREGRMQFLVSAFAVSLARFLLMAGGLAVTVLLAATYGASSDTDAYFIARLIPVTLVSPAAVAFNLAFVPVYIRLLEKGEGEARRLARRFAVVVTVGATVGAAVYAAASPLIIAALMPRSPEAIRHSAMVMTLIMAPAIPLTALHAVFESVLNARRRFVIAAASSVFVPMCALIGVIWLSQWLGLPGLALGVVLGFALQAASLALFIRPYFERPAAQAVEGGALRNALLDLALAATMLFTWQLNTIVDRGLANHLGEGAQAALSFGVNLIGLVPLLVAFPVYRVLYPELVRLAVADDRPRLLDLFQRNILLVAILSLPVAIGVVMFAQPLTALALKYGQFSAEGAEQTSQVVLYLGLGLPATLAAILPVYFFVVTRRAKLLLKVMGITVVANILLDLLLMWLLGIGGIALTSSLIAIVRTCILMAIIAGILGGPIVRPVVRPLMHIGACAALTGLAMYVAYALLSRPLPGDGPLEIAVRLAGAGATGGAVYLAGCHLTGCLRAAIRGRREVACA